MMLKTKWMQRLNLSAIWFYKGRNNCMIILKFSKPKTLYHSNYSHGTITTFSYDKLYLLVCTVNIGKRFYDKYTCSNPHHTSKCVSHNMETQIGKTQIFPVCIWVNKAWKFRDNLKMIWTFRCCWSARKTITKHFRLDSLKLFRDNMHEWSMCAAVKIEESADFWACIYDTSILQIITNFDISLKTFNSSGTLRVPACHVGHCPNACN